MSDHSVRIIFDGRVWFEFDCHAAPDADCRTKCEHEACNEHGCSAPGNHRRVRIDYCNVVAWMMHVDQPATARPFAIEEPISIHWTPAGVPQWALAFNTASIR